LFLAQKAHSVFGVEVVPEAIGDAKRNAFLNEITNAEFAAGIAEVVIQEWYKEGNSADVLVVDPPHKGCDEALLQTIIEMKPKKVVYVSCNLATLARDLRILEGGGFKTVEVQPVDMFPMTTHVETVVRIEKK
jgi:23S rRNA (uracil1939-C5)-methyltransferase